MAANPPRNLAKCVSSTVLRRLNSAWPLANRLIFKKTKISTWLREFANAKTSTRLIQVRMTSHAHGLSWFSNDVSEQYQTLSRASGRLRRVYTEVSHCHLFMRIMLPPKVRMPTGRPLSGTRSGNSQKMQKRQLLLARKERIRRIVLFQWILMRGNCPKLMLLKRIEQSDYKARSCCQVAAK